MKEVSASLPAHLTADPRDASPKAKNTLGKDDFMKLLMAQLQNQDPLKPVDHHEFVAQLAQFGSLEQLTNIQKGIEGLHSGIGDESKISAIGLIGKRVEAAGSQVELMEGQTVSMRYSRKEGVTPAKAYIYTEGGKLVRELDLSAKTDTDSIKWDGKDADGKTLPSGQYTFRVQGTDNVGQAQEMGTELSGRVTGVDMEGKSPMLLVKTASGTTKIDMAKIKNVATDDTPPAGNTVPGAKTGSVVAANNSELASPLAAGSARKSIPMAGVDSENRVSESDDGTEREPGAIAGADTLDQLWGGLPNFIGGSQR